MEDQDVQVLGEGKDHEEAQDANEEDVLGPVRRDPVYIGCPSYRRVEGGGHPDNYKNVPRLCLQRLSKVHPAPVFPRPTLPTDVELFQVNFDLTYKIDTLGQGKKHLCELLVNLCKSVQL